MSRHRIRRDPYAVHRVEAFTTDNRSRRVIGEYLERMRALGRKFNKSAFFRDAIVEKCEALLAVEGELGIQTKLSE